MTAATNSPPALENPLDAQQQAPLDLCVTQMDRLGAQLQQTSSQIESAVVDVCDRFNSIAEKARAETSRLVDLLNPAHASSESQPFEVLLHSCSQVLGRLLNAQSHSNSLISDAVERIRKIDASASRIEDALAKLGQISHGNRLLALNARIEAAHSPQQERGFNAVAVELAAQTDRANKLTDEVGDLSSLLRSLADSSVSDLEHLQNENTQFTARTQTEVNGTLNDLAAAYQKLHDAVGQSQKESSLLAEDINEAIRRMQFQDRVGQQIAHVIHDLKAVKTWVSNTSTMNDTAPQFSAHVMHEERAVHSCFGEEAPEGDVDLF